MPSRRVLPPKEALQLPPLSPWPEDFPLLQALVCHPLKPPVEPYQYKNCLELATGYSARLFSVCLKDDSFPASWIFKWWSVSGTPPVLLKDHTDQYRNQSDKCKASDVYLDSKDAQLHGRTWIFVDFNDSSPTEQSAVGPVMFRENQRTDLFLVRNRWGGSFVCWILISQSMALLRQFPLDASDWCR